MSDIISRAERHCSNCYCFVACDATCRADPPIFTTATPYTNVYPYVTVDGWCAKWMQGDKK